MNKFKKKDCPHACDCKIIKDVPEQLVCSCNDCGKILRWNFHGRNLEQRREWFEKERKKNN